MERISKTEYYLNIAEEVMQRSTCLNKHWGAVIVKDDTIISTGFNGAPRCMKDCLQKGFCNLYDYRRKNNLGRGTAYEQCLSVHAEMNAMIFADKDKLQGSTLYLAGEQCDNLDGIWMYVSNAKPCAMCRKLIINAGIKNVIVRQNEKLIQVFEVDGWEETDVIGGY